MAFQNMDLRSSACFGMACSDSSQGWVKLAETSISEGWTDEFRDQIEDDLSQNVMKSYFKICQFDAEDMDTKILWHAEFVNDLGLWKISIHDSPDADVSIEDMNALIDSEFFKEFVIHAGQAIDKAIRIYNEVIDSHLADGDLLDVDEVKLARILYCADLKWWMDNLRQGKFSI